MTADAVVSLLHPAVRHGLQAPDLLDLYAVADRRAPLVRANFVSSVDGSATADGVSGGLGGPADRLVFDVLRQLADVIVVAAGTIRAEGYSGALVSPEAEAWRRSHGLAPHPAVAVVSGSLALDPSLGFFTESPVRPLVVTARSSDAGKRRALGAVADVVDCGDETVDAALLVSALVERGLPQIHCEGGPSLLGSFIAADVLDELCLTVSPTLEGGAGPRITRGEPLPELRALTLDHVLLAGSMLLTRYSRVR